MALDEVRRHDRTLGGTAAPADNNASRMVAMFQQLPENERHALLAGLAAQLSVTTQLEVLELLVTRLSPDRFRELEEELRQRLVGLAEGI